MVEQRQNLWHPLLIFGLLLLAMLPPPSGYAQEPSGTDVLSAGPDDAKPEAPEKVEVDPLARDHEIERRLQSIFDEILTETERFKQIEVTVRDGVVYLSGEASEEEYRTWAGDLAKNTQDVVAVVNRLTVSVRPIWDMSPAITELSRIWRSTVQTLPLILFGAIALVLTSFAARLTSRSLGWAVRSKIENRLLRRVVSRAATIPIVLVGIYIVLQVLDLTQLAMTVVGGTGLAGLIIGIAFRDIAENLLASILISVQNPFRVGDIIEVDGKTGFVQGVTTRGTVLMTFDGNQVQIPNAIIYKNTIINFSANPNRRVDFEIGIGYDDSVSDAQKIALRVLMDHPAVRSDPTPRVVLRLLGASTVNLRVYFWVDAKEHNWESVQSSVMRLVKQALQEADISMPDEAREVIFPSGVPVQMLEQRPGDEESHVGRQESPRLPTEPASPSEFKPAQREEVLSEGEGTLASESEELKRQADASWEPDGGTNLLEPHGDERN